MEFNATFIVTIISFILFIVIMNLILYKPINEMVEKRQKFIDENYNEAKNNSDSAKKLLENRDERLKQTQIDAREKSAQKISEIKNRENELALNKKNEIKNELSKNIEEINAQSNDARQVLKSQIVELAQLISDKFIETDQKVEADNELIESIMHG